jgi:hypothetical protein
MEWVMSCERSKRRYRGFNYASPKVSSSYDMFVSPIYQILCGDALVLGTKEIGKQKTARSFACCALLSSQQ